MRRGNAYTILFTLAIAVLAAFFLSVTSFMLKERQQLQAAGDMKKNILHAVGIRKCKDKGPGSVREIPKDQLTYIQECYRKYIRAIVIDSEGRIITGEAVVPEAIELDAELDKPVKERRYPLYMRIDNGKASAYCFPVYGKGLWSSIYGYMALEADCNTVRGVTFYKQGETPGLGGEVQSDWFQDSFIGKKILDEKGGPVSITVLKGKAAPSSPGAIHQVDGISGATLTGKGVTALLKKSILLYEPYFKLIRNGRGRGGI